MVFAGDPVAGKIKSAACAACHQIDGNSIAPNWPKLAGQHKNYLAKQLRDYQKGEAGPRYSPEMIGMVLNLTEQDIQDLAAYFSTQKSTKNKALAKYVKLGERLYRGGNKISGVPACTACHSPQGEGNPFANYPAISGQHATYIQAQLRAFKSKQRHNDKNNIMQDIAKKMSEEEIVAVSEYMAGLH